MNFFQRLVTRFLPDAEAESRKWVFTCPNCQQESDIWEIGGVRYKAYSKGKWTGIKCPKCGQFHMMAVKKKG